LGFPQTAGFGGLIRNSVGFFLGGFYGVASQASILYAEIMAMLHGLELCWDKGFKQVICLSDSLQTVTVVKEGVPPYHKFANEITSIHQLLPRDWTIVINHMFREGNVC
jgi:ribonuclease HI